jgi:hypothetical protein
MEEIREGYAFERHRAVVLYKVIGATGAAQVRSADRQPRPRITANGVFPRTALTALAHPSHLDYTEQ